ncbi:hypothetical protein LAZ67_5003035 [Cordylochernes scorpioides]|uniref:Transposase n=1 Tax=Cordylochernes scorpioides TaxID=51811 RepID=A0ABY6KHZ5_9ARAC|nr:hypothetical protein LAZ67_5003035 [Cordylochernes scorpioides]
MANYIQVAAPEGFNFGKPNEWPEIFKKEVLRPEALEKAVNLEDSEKAAESQLSKELLEESNKQGSCIKAESHAQREAENSSKELAEGSDGNTQVNKQYETIEEMPEINEMENQVELDLTYLESRLELSTVKILFTFRSILEDKYDKIELKGRGRLSNCYKISDTQVCKFVMVAKNDANKYASYLYAAYSSEGFKFEDVSNGILELLNIEVGKVKYKDTKYCRKCRLNKEEIGLPCHRLCKTCWIGHLEKSVGIGSAAINTIINNHLKYKKLVSRRWVPHNLTEDQKHGGIKWCNFILKKIYEGSFLILQVATLELTILIQKQNGNLLFDALQNHLLLRKFAELEMLENKWLLIFL